MRDTWQYDTNTLSCSLLMRRGMFVSAAYNHALYLEPRVKMKQEWADLLENTQRGAKVLPFREREGVE